jgi:hypothetical protein
MFVEKLLIDDFYYVNQPVSNINTDEFTNKQNVLNKKYYRHHFISNFIGEYVISPTYKIICNSIGDLFHINERQNPSVINILSVAFHVMFFNFLELFDIFSLSVILSVMCLIFFLKKIQINRLEKKLKEIKLK